MERQGNFQKTFKHFNSNTNIFRASNTFCQLACGMFCSLGDFLRSGSDEIIKNMYDISDDIDEEDNNNRLDLMSITNSFLDIAF